MNTTPLVSPVRAAELADDPRSRNIASREWVDEVCTYLRSIAAALSRADVHLCKDLRGTDAFEFPSMAQDLMRAAATEIEAQSLALAQLRAGPDRSDVEALVEKLEGLGSKTCSKAAKMISELAVSRGALRVALAQQKAEVARWQAEFLALQACLNGPDGVADALWKASKRAEAAEASEARLRAALQMWVHHGTLHEDTSCPEDDTCTCLVAAAVNAALTPTASGAAPADGEERINDGDRNMTETQIKYMVDRFLRWKLPENFSPDAGISFKKTYNEHTAHPAKHEPVGTNLFDATQAEAMVRFMIEGLP